MARINTYNLDQIIRPDDLVIGSSYEGEGINGAIYLTRNYRLSKLAEFFIGYDFNAGLSLTTLEGIVDQAVLDISSLETDLTALTSRVSVNESDISQNTIDIAGNASDIIALTSTVQTNTNNIGVNTSSIATINTNIANRANWDTAYNEAVTGIAVTSNETGSVKTITLTRRNASALSEDFTDIFETGSGGITDTNNYVDSASFNASTGVLTLGRLDLADLTVSTFDSRYYTEAEVDTLLNGKSDTGHTHTTSDITNLESYTGFDSRYINATGDTMTGPLSFGDNVQLRLGGTNDFRLYHNGTDNIIHSDNGDWVFFDGITNVTRISRADGNISIGGNAVWHAGNDGPGTGLDADTVDGKQLANMIAEKDALPADTSMKSSTLQSGVYRINTLTTASVGDGLQVVDAPVGAAAYGTLVNYKNSADTFYRIYKNYQGGRMWVFSGNTSGSSQSGWFEVWNSGNDGTGTGLDADTVDGLEASQFLRSDANDSTTGSITITAATPLTLNPTGDVGIQVNSAGPDDWIIRGDSNNVNISGLFINGSENGTLLLRDSAGTIGAWIKGAGESTLNHQLTVSDEISCGSVVFSAISAVANANNFETFMPQTSSIMTLSHTTGATNYPSVSGQTLLVRGNSAGRSFAIDRPNNGTFLSMGTWNSTSWTWSQIVDTANSADFGSNTLTAQNFILSSDARLKSNVEDIAPRADVQWRQFELGGDLRYGVIAQEVEEIYPEFVHTDEKGYKSVSYTDILVAENAKLRSRVEELEKDVNIIKEMLKDGFKYR